MSKPEALFCGSPAERPTQIVPIKFHFQDGATIGASPRFSVGPLFVSFSSRVMLEVH